MVRRSARREHGYRSLRDRAQSRSCRRGDAFRDHNGACSRTERARRTVWAVFLGKNGNACDGPETTITRERGVRRLFLEALEAILAKYGFVPGHQTGRFEREFPGGFQRIIAPTWDFKPSYPFALMVEVQFACINDTAKRVFGANFAKPPGLFNMIGHLVYPQDRQKHSLPIRSISDMDAAMRVVAITVDTKIMPFLDRLNTVVEFERFINADTSTSERW
jgi:hypothetical protein